MEEKKRNNPNENEPQLTPEEAAQEAVRMKREREQEEAQRRINMTDALMREVYALRESVENLKRNNEMLCELASVNLSPEGESVTPNEAYIKKLVRENESYKKLALDRIKDIIISKVRAEFPDMKYNSFEDFPEEFHRLVCAHVSPETAYRVTIENKDGKKPKAMGKVNENSESEKDFYTSKEADKLTKKQLSNPKVMEAVMKSMLKW